MLREELYGPIPPILGEIIFERLPQALRLLIRHQDKGVFGRGLLGRGNFGGRRLLGRSRFR
jgi:hypothetical protein